MFLFLPPHPFLGPVPLSLPPSCLSSYSLLFILLLFLAPRPVLVPVSPLSLCLLIQFHVWARFFDSLETNPLDSDLLSTLLFTLQERRSWQPS